MKRIGLVVVAVAARAAMAAGVSGGREVEIAAFERFADLAVKLPPVIRTTNVSAYSTNRLDFALNNGLGMTAKGRLWASWIAGGDGPDSFTVASWSDDRGDTWSDVAFVIDGHGDVPTKGNICGRTNIIGTFWLDPAGRFHVYTDQSVFHHDGRAGVWDALAIDPDATPPTWGPAVRIGNGHLMNKPTVLANGKCAVAGYLNEAWKNSNFAAVEGAFRDLDAERGATCYVSSDKGLTWEKRGSVPFPANDWNEASVVELGDGTLRMFARVWADGRGKIMVADSKDEGRTWTKPYCLKTMNNPNARFQVQRLKSGRLLFVKHGAPAVGGEAWQGRDHLTAYLSDDDGETWRGGLELFAGASSYPDACQGPDGTIYVTHDHDRGGKAEIWFHRFTEEDVLAKRIVSSNGRLNVLVSRAMASKANRKKAEGTCSPDGTCPAPAPEAAGAMLPSGKVTLGANYWASHAATQMWCKWNAAEVEKDLVALKAAGMTFLRVFPNWADFQPIVAVPLSGANCDVTRETRMFLSEEPLPDTPCGRAGVDERMVEHFEEFCDLAEKHGFRLIVPLLTGQMTFRNFVPPALVHLDPFADPYALVWEARYVECMVSRLKAKRAIAAWETGNEARILGKCEGKERAEFWQRYIHDIIRRADPTRPVVGVDGLELTSACSWPTEVNARFSDYVTTHPYHFWNNGYLDDFRTIRSTTYASAMTHALADVAGRPAFVEEHGSRRQEQASQRHVADYLRAVLWNVWDSDCRAMLWWCAFDQTGLEIAPYNWKEPCVELGIFRRDRTPYPGVESVRKFAAFQTSLPFAALPKPKPNVHFIVSNGDVMHAAFILAKQAGLRPSFQSAEQPIRDAKTYFLPVARGRAHLTLANWRALKEKVAAGATLYLSLDDTFLDSLEEVAGIEIDYRDGAAETLDCAFPGFRLTLGSAATRRYRTLTAETLAKDKRGNGVFFCNRYGKGKVYTLTVPMEARLYRMAGKFATDAHKVYGLVAPTWQLVRTGARDVTATEHCFGGGRCGVVVVNNSPTPYAGRPEIAKGWSVRRALTDSPELAKWRDGSLELGPNAGILLMVAKDGVEW